jgi:outer membrane protein OmpA-like peptidoglycan-associated protein
MSKLPTSVLLVLMVLIPCAGCQSTGAGLALHTFPELRDYNRLDKTTLTEASAALEEAEQAGGAVYAPYTLALAQQYLSNARRLHSQGDLRGAWDYATLAREQAQVASYAGQAFKSTPFDPPADKGACQGLYNAVLADVESLDADTMESFAPVPYAAIVSRVSLAEHELLDGDWRAAGALLADAKNRLTILSKQDSDGDGVPDVIDAAPNLPEDHDGYQDADGIPDPDNDSDGVPDAVDIEPMQMETPNRWHDYDGAPDNYPELEAIPFTKASATLSPAAKGYLRGLVLILKEWPDLKLHIRGFGDTGHSEQYEMELSKRRAQEVQDYLLEMGAAPDQPIATFHGTRELPSEPPARGHVVLAFE